MCIFKKINILCCIDKLVKVSLWLLCFLLLGINFWNFEFLLNNIFRNLFTEHNLAFSCILQIFLTSFSNLFPISFLHIFNKFILLLNCERFEDTSETLFLRRNWQIISPDYFNFYLFQSLIRNLCIQCLFYAFFKGSICLSWIRIHIRI